MPPAVLDVDRVQRLARADLELGELVREADAILRPAIGYDGAAWAAVDPASLLLTSCTPVGFHPYAPHLRFRIFERESRGRGATTIRRLVRRDPPVTTTDEQDRGRAASPSDAGAPEPVDSSDIAGELVAALIVDGRCWGAARFWRTGRGGHPFGDGHADRVAELSRPLGEGLRRAFLRRATAGHGGVDDPPGVLTLDRTGHIVAVSDHARTWLDRLGERGDEPEGRVDDATGTVSTVLVSLAADVATTGTASAVVAGPGGPVALHASRLGPDGAPPDGARVPDTAPGTAVALGHPRPGELTPRIMEAYELTRRERQVTALVLRGLTTAQIARSLGVSRYTVQDHLKSVFAKVGVQTRGELANAIHVRLSLPPAHEDAGATEAGGARPGR